MTTDITATSGTIPPVKKIPRPNLRFGFEFEFLVKTTDYGNVLNSFEELGFISFGSDGSIRSQVGYTPVEMRTNYLPYVKAERLLQEILSNFYILSQADLVRSDSSCGFHANMSEKKLFDENKSLEYYCHVLSKFPEDTILDKFKRKSNRYCRLVRNRYKIGKSIMKDPAKLINRLKLEHQLNGLDKYMSVTLRRSTRYNSNRIEFRCFGNKDYYLKDKLLNDSLSTILSSAKEAHKACV